MSRWAWACLILAHAISVYGQTITPKETIPLFNGRDLSGLYTWLKETKRQDPTKVFRLTNGMIQMMPSLGYLATEREYESYELHVEFKWGHRISSWRKGKARDSGIFLHATGPDGNSHDGNGAFMAAIECNLFQGATGDILLIRGDDAHGKVIAPRITAFVSEQRDAEHWRWCRSSGHSVTIEQWGRLNWINKSPAWKDELDFRGQHDVENPYGQWNHVKCVCDGDTIRVELNGQLVNMARDVRPRAGKILLQSEGSEIFFRKLELRPLPRASKDK